MKLEIPFGHVFDRQEVSSDKGAVGIPSVCDRPSRRLLSTFCCPHSDVEAARRSAARICVGSSRIVKSGSTKALRIWPSASIT